MDNKSVQKLIEDHVESGSMESLSLPVLPMGIYGEIFKDLGDDEQNIDTNGWQVDFWWELVLNSDPYTMAGSWWYGSYTLTRGD